MEAFSSLAEKCPDWIKRLDELTHHIQKRQAELATLSTRRQSEQADEHVVIKSLKNRGSTESLRPRDEANAQISPEATETTSHDGPAEPRNEVRRDMNDESLPLSPGGASLTESTKQRHTNQIIQIAQARARAVFRSASSASIKRQRHTDSMFSGEGQMPKYRTRTMVLVYYDSYVQSFFEELIRFVSISRSLIRKAKMGSRYAQLKRAADLEVSPPSMARSPVSSQLVGTGGPAMPYPSPGAVTVPPTGWAPGGPMEIEVEADAKDSSEDIDMEQSLPQLPYVSTRKMGRAVRGPAEASHEMPIVFARAGHSGLGYVGGNGRPPPAAEAAGNEVMLGELDKRLEAVQSLCEHAAHQFLRDGDCSHEVESMKEKLAETKTLAEQELDKQDSAQNHDETSVSSAPVDRPRSTMKREFEPTLENGGPGMGSNALMASQPLEVDDNMDNETDGLENMPDLIRLGYGGFKRARVTSSNMETDGMRQ